MFEVTSVSLLSLYQRSTWCTVYQKYQRCRRDMANIFISCLKSSRMKLYSENPELKCRPGDRQILLIFSMSFLSSFRQIPKQYIRLG